MTRRSLDTVVRVRTFFGELWERALLRGNFAAMSFLICAAFVTVLSGAIVLSLTGIDVKAEGDGFLQALWEVLLRAMSPDQLTGQDTWSARLILLAVTVFGLLLFSTLISITNSSLTQRFEQVRRGRRPIHLQGHIALLNWNEFGFRVLREIAEANSGSASARRVTILCDQDPLELLRHIQANFRDHAQRGGGDTKWLRKPETWITVRRGKGHHTTDLLNLAAIGEADGAIVLQDEETDDSHVVRCVLAISAALRSQGQDSSRLAKDLPVVTFNSRSPLATRLDSRLTTITSSIRRDNHRHLNYVSLSPDEIRAGIETQVARHRGLSYAYQDLLDFGGEELYILDPPHGFTTFGEAFLGLLRCIPIGIAVADSVDLWPDWSSDITHKAICVLARDRRQTSLRNRVILSSLPTIRARGRPPLSEKENFLFVGWNESADQLRTSLMGIVAKGSSLKVLLRERDERPTDMKFGDTEIQLFQRHHNDPLDDFIFLDGINHVVVFADMNVTPQQSDAQALIDLFACRHYADRLANPDRRFTIVGELRRRSSRHVAGVRLADDLLISESLMAAAATQLVFEPRLEKVITSLLSSSNPVELITLRLSRLGSESETSWYELRLRLARTTGEIAIGIRTTLNGDPTVILNPDANFTVTASDEVVILSKCDRGSPGIAVP